MNVVNEFLLARGGGGEGCAVTPVWGGGTLNRGRSGGGVYPITNPCLCRGEGERGIDR